MFSLNKWLESKSDILGAWASLFGIIAFPTVIVATILGFFQLKEFYEKPDLHIEFANPEALTYTLANRKDVLAEQPLYWFGIVDIDGPPVTTIPFPAKEISYILGNGRKGPNTFGSLYCKKGHRYFGFAGINCKNCDKTRRYWLYFVHGNKKGAWYREMMQNERQDITVNPIELSKNPEKYLNDILPKHKRFSIE